jgi:hypothetical protein
MQTTRLRLPVTSPSAPVPAAAPAPVAAAPPRPRAASPVAVALRLVGAAGLAVSAWIHRELYVDEGYRDIHLDRVLGVDLSRSILLQVVVASVVALALVASARWRALALPASALGALVALGSLGAYYRTRTDTLLGFSEGRWTTDAKVAVASEVVAAVALVAAAALAICWSRVRRAIAAPTAA